MSRVVSLILLVCVLGPCGAPKHAWAQQARGSTPTRRAGVVANLFETLDPSSLIDGVQLQLPENWRLRGAHLLRYGTKAVRVHRRSGPDDTVLLSTDTPVQGPHKLVLRVQVGERPGLYRWHLTPFVRRPASSAPDSLPQRDLRTLDRQTRRVRVDPPAQPTGSNRVLDLSEASSPVQAELPSSVAPGRDRPFTIEFWMRTSGLDQVPLSAWTGVESTAYPFEFVVDQSGHLRFYCGRAGRHEALRSRGPVADGHWHHVAVTYAPSDNRLRLLLDGTSADSLQPSALPSVSGPLPIAIGGRRPSATTDGSPQRRFTGRLDEVRVWPEARSQGALRVLRTRPYVASEEMKTEKPFRLHFDETTEPRTLDWPRGSQRVHTTLTFQSPLRGLRARTDGRSVTLHWTASAVEDGTFIVERSPDGRSFTEVERLSALDAEPSSDPQEIAYTDTDIPSNVVYYRVRQASATTDTEHMTGTIKIGLGADTSSTRAVELVGNFPNPFKKSTTIAYRVHEAQSLTLTVWNLSGKRVTRLADGMHEPGYYERTLTANNLPSGPFFARIKTPQGVQSHRMILLK